MVLRRVRQHGFQPVPRVSNFQIAVAYHQLPMSAPCAAPLASHDRAGRIGLGDRVVQPARIDLEGRPRLDERPEGRFVEVRPVGELCRDDMGMDVSLDDVEMPDRVEEPGPGSRHDLGEVRLDDLVQCPAGHPAIDTAPRVRRAGPVVDRADREVVACRARWSRTSPPSPVVRQLGLGPDREPAIGPSAGGVADKSLRGVERRVSVAGSPGSEIDVMVIASSRMPRATERGSRRRSARGCQATDVDVGVEGQVARLARSSHPAGGRTVADGVGAPRAPGRASGRYGPRRRPEAGLVDSDSRGTTGWTNTPSSRRRSLNRPAVAESPIITGVIGVSDAGVETRSDQLGLEAAGVRPEALDELRLVLETDPRDRRRRRRAGPGREEERAGALDEHLAELPRAGRSRPGHLLPCSACRPDGPAVGQSGRPCRGRSARDARA